MDVAEVFQVYASHNGMDIRAFIKSMKDSGLLDEHFTKVDADLAFFKCTARHTRKIGLEDFVQILKCIAKRRSVSDQEVFQQAASGASETTLGRERCSEAKHSSGPERFFYDIATYTGIHRQDKSEQERRRPASSSQPSRAVRTGARSASPRGPERFFYDKTTYTGTHRNGGPTVSGNGLPKESFKDLSEVGLRSDTPKERPRCRPKSTRPERQHVEGHGEEHEAAITSPPEVQTNSLPVLLGQFPRQSVPKCFGDLRGKLQKMPKTAALIGTRFIPVNPIPMSLDLSVDSSNLSSLLELSD
ncbi:unnamed protein product [Durusdinium trenchii]|uniref:Uncharacterized protein n=2 Tax=Durusdinium trenchii TaxID=1381693 RepID=A0ABP0KKM1_9DINO